MKTNKKRPKEKHPVHNDLSVWGNLSRLETALSLSFSSSGYALAEFEAYGLKLSRGGTRQVVWPDKYKKLDTLIGNLIRTKPAWGKAVKDYYTSGIAKNKVRMIAAKQRVSKSTFHDRLQHGRDWINDEMKVLH
ncbi:MAG: hypothetical protein COV52_02300 [Gammaproteobacteria bacterium CG11_big_fil_rev_8_21_14_0_20_46_22]|nr:MAG: hypothetical protein COW05_01295 [Gammaproteobacteria bacterium CG12_big_fil_rev_8_21_14_0_65_46_12]PIR11762.1 MAG: hypothetical protein COV52_02300 [Gammaproteobacteria bacterium CG11_big_fil_rev_8_21_14_0_20_46_22]